MSVAVTSLPVPLSPVMSTVLSLSWITRRNSNTARIRPLVPTTIESAERAGILPASPDAKRPDPRDRLPQGRGHPEVQRHLRARTIRTRASEAHVDRVPG